MTIETAEHFVVDPLGDLPTFCALAFRDDNPTVVSSIDFWAVEPCGSGETDYLRGQGYADEALWHVWVTGQRVLIECVLMFIAIKLRQSDRHAGSLEYGFVDRIAHHYPDAIEQALGRLLRRYPKMVN
jgi:hypothetical protein